MGYQNLSMKLPTDYTEGELKKEISLKLKIRDFSFQVEKKSLDARKKSNIHWQMQISVFSEELKGELPEPETGLEVPYKKREEKVIVVGSGPAGFFAALLLQKAGFKTTLIERGSEVKKRAAAIYSFEQDRVFDPDNNYAFGEGGAGTFSDGKLTSRSKRISAERQFILSNYIKAGAPEEINYLAHPHVGSDILKVVVRNLRKEFLETGGEILFDTMLQDLKILNGQIKSAVTSAGILDADHFIIASGHSAYETQRMLIRNGVRFQTKNFAIGARVEHLQSVINSAQWGKESLPGVKAAEYRLTANPEGCLPVYTFCMCPGGVVVPATAYANANIVNGMSNYRRGGEFANAACVAGVNLDSLLGREISPEEALDWLETLEQSFYESVNGYQAPGCRISDFISKKVQGGGLNSSYPLGVQVAPLWELLPQKVSESISEGLKDFSRRLRGFETGVIMGLESKTSASIQALRDENRLCSGFDNLYLAGEGSGHAGGIISSAADGIKVALSVVGLG